MVLCSLLEVKSENIPPLTRIIRLYICSYVSYCQTNGTRYVLLYEYESTPIYYGSPLNQQAVYSILNSTGRFDLDATFGDPPRRMYVVSFNN